MPSHNLDIVKVDRLKKLYNALQTSLGEIVGYRIIDLAIAAYQQCSS
ncbi:hypothetical protein [Pseudanabaena sp. Chao 1811]|nr:hypothetical protein [Pseudanabaena sp. Chao 1811]